MEEFLAWSGAVDRFGILALRATLVQQYKHEELGIQVRAYALSH